MQNMQTQTNISKVANKASKQQKLAEKEKPSPISDADKVKVNTIVHRLNVCPTTNVWQASVENTTSFTVFVTHFFFSFASSHSAAKSQIP